MLTRCKYTKWHNNLLRLIKSLTMLDVEFYRIYIIIHVQQFKMWLILLLWQLIIDCKNIKWSWWHISYKSFVCLWIICKWSGACLCSSMNNFMEIRSLNLFWDRVSLCLDISINISDLSWTHNLTIGHHPRVDYVITHWLGRMYPHQFPR